MPLQAMRTSDTSAPPALGYIESRADALRICRRVEDTMEGLLQLIEAESVLLRAGKAIAAAALEPRKSDFAKAYLDDLKLLRVIGPELEHLAPEAVDRLRRLHEEFVAVLQIDMAALVATKAATGNESYSAPVVRADFGQRRIPQRLAASSRR